MTNIFIILPAYNEQKYIKQVIKKILAIHSQIILVDDGSSDNTSQIASQLPITLLAHPVNLGKGAALKTGCDYAFKQLNAEAVILMDADDQHDPELIPQFIKVLKTHSLILGTRIFNGQMPLVRFLGNKFSSVVINLLCGVYISDIPSGFKAFTKDIYPQISWSSPGYEVETEIAVAIARKKLPFIEIPIPTIYHDDYKGVSLLDSLKILTQLPKWLLK